MSTPRMFRAQGLVKPSILRTKKVVLVGAGNVGSHMLQALPLPLLGKIVLIDYDRFGQENVERHTLGKSAEGHYKVKKLTEWLVDHNVLPERIETHSCRVEEVLDQHSDADLVIETTGSTSGAREYVNRMVDCPVLYVGVYPKTLGGLIIAATDSSGGCYLCAQHILGRLDSSQSEDRHCGDGDEELIAPEERDELIAVPHLNFTTLVVAGLAGEMALSVLHGRRVKPQIVEYLSPWQPAVWVPEGSQVHRALAGFVGSWGKLGYLPHYRLGKDGGEKVLQVRQIILSRPLAKWSACPLH